MDEFKIIKIADIQESGDNPRKKYDGIEALAQSIKDRGIIEPLVVREWCSDAGHGKGFELIAGHRRLRAAKSAGLSEVPCMVRKANDLDAEKDRMAENALRADLEPMEEAEALLGLKERHKCGWAEIARIAGRSKATVYARAALLGLPEKAKAALRKGALHVALAEEIARLPTHAEMVQALGIAENARSLEGFREGIAGLFLALSRAPFDVRQAYAGASGPCSGCKKRTAADPGLFGEAADEDRCLEKSCWEAKARQELDRRSAEAKAAGWELLQGKKAQEAQWSLQEDTESDWRLKEGATWRQALKGTGFKGFKVFFDAKRGKWRRALDREEAIKCVPKEFRWSGSGEGGKEDPSIKAGKLRQKIERAAVQAMCVALFEAGKRPSKDARLLRAVVETLADDWQFCQFLKESGIPLWAEKGGALRDGYGEKKTVEKARAAFLKDEAKVRGVALVYLYQHAKYQGGDALKEIESAAGLTWRDALRGAKKALKEPKVRKTVKIGGAHFDKKDMEEAARGNQKKR